MSRQQELKLIDCIDYFFSRKVIALIPRSTWRSLETSQGAKLDMLYAELTPEEEAKLWKCRQSGFWKVHQLDKYLTYTARQLANLHPHLMDTGTRSYNTSQLVKHENLYAERRRNLPPDTVSYIDLIFRNWAQELGPLVVKKQQVAQAAEKRAARLAKKTGNSQTGFRMRKSRKTSRKRKSSKRKASRKRSRKRRSAKRKTSRKRKSSKRKASRKRSRKRRSSKRCPAGCVKKKTSKRKSRKVKKKLKFKIRYSGPRGTPSNN